MTFKIRAGYVNFQANIIFVYISKRPGVSQIVFYPLVLCEVVKLI